MSQEHAAFLHIKYMCKKNAKKISAVGKIRLVLANYEFLKEHLSFLSAKEKSLRLESLRDQINMALEIAQQMGKLGFSSTLNGGVRLSVMHQI